MEFQLVAVQTLKKSVEVFNMPKKKGFQFGLSIDSKFYTIAKDSIVFADFTIKGDHQAIDKGVSIFEFIYRFQFKVKDLDKIPKVNKLTDFPKSDLIVLASIAFSTSRGLLIRDLEGTPMNFVLHIVDPNDLVDAKYEGIPEASDILDKPSNEIASAELAGS